MMQRNVAAVRPNETLEDVARLLRDRSCGCVIVVDDERKPLGVVTDRDVCLAALRSGEPIDAIRASAAMSSRLIDFPDTLASGKSHRSSMVSWPLVVSKRSLRRVAFSNMMYGILL